MKITDVNPKHVSWKQQDTFRTCKYSAVYDKIRMMDIGKVFQVELDEPRKSFGALVSTNFRKYRRQKSFRIRTHKVDREGKVWLIQKKEVKR